MLVWFVTATLTMLIWAGFWGSVETTPTFLKFVFLIAVPVLVTLAVSFFGSRKKGA